MLPPPDSQGGVSLNLIEAGLTAIAVAASFAWPRLGSSWFARIESTFGRLARRKGAAVAVVGLAALLIRLAILPICPIPLPFVPDDFSFLLACDTFLHGRLANPTPAMWVHFETIHVDMKPTYMSMYFPAEGLVLAAGKLLLGHPWFGVLCIDALMCAALCWMLQAWLPPTWAFVGGMIVVVRLGLFSYWINTYAGGSGLLVALGGALVLGALPRLMRTVRIRYGLLLAIGVVIMAIARPYEGLLICLPMAVALGHWAFFGKTRPSAAVLARRAALPIALVIAGIAWLGYYDYRAFGSPTTLPYTINRATYATAPYFVWQKPRPEPVYRHEDLRRFYNDKELAAFYLLRGWSGFANQVTIKVARALLFFAGFVLLPPLIMLRRVILDRRIRFLLICQAVLMAGMVIEVFMIPHYLAAFTVIFYAIGLQAMRHLWVWKPSGAPAGRAMVRFLLTLCVLLAGLRLCIPASKLAITEWPASVWSGFWFGPLHFGEERATIESNLERAAGTHLVLVRYAPTHDSIDEWVYNGADIDGSKVVWAREMDAADNQELIHYYPNRKVWLVDPDAPQSKISPYPMPQEASSAPR
jgi:hypothetical protein